MGYSARQPCHNTRCADLAERGKAYCPRHSLDVDTVREVRQKMYNTAMWRKRRSMCLSEQPLCVVCSKDGIVTAANEVDHIKPHRGDYKLFIDDSNLQSLCKQCHSKKTSRERKDLI